MSQEQYNTLLSNLLKEKRALTKLRVELERRKGKLCRNCRGFRHLARNCRKGKKEEKGVATPQNKFKILSSRVMQYGVEKRAVRSIRSTAVKYFKCGEEEHKYRECPLWERKVKRVACPKGGKVYQGERRLACSVREKAQEGEKRLRRVEEGEVVCPVQREVQQGRKRSLMEKLRKKVEKHCGKDIPREVQLLELGWMTEEVVVLYLTCKCRKKGSHVKDNQGQGVIPFWKWKELSWCRYKRKTEGRATQPREAKA